MSKSLHILVVEDSESDFLLLLAELRRKGYEPVHLRVETAVQMQAALQKRCWDVVISDYVLPQFSAPDALTLLQESRQDIPFIVVSGVFGEEAAVHMMKAGADDYITKGNLSRLAPAIERELEAGHTRRAKARAEAAMQHLAAIVESSEDAIYSKNLDSMIVSWNPAAERIFGYRAEEVVGRSIAVLFPFNHWDELLDTMSTIRRGELVGFKETYRKCKDGRIIPVSMTISPIKNADGTVIGASTILRDITEKKQGEEERLKLIEELTESLGHVKALSGLLPICASCKRIRDEQDSWQPVETYVSQRSDATFSHALCPDCSKNYLNVLDQVSTPGKRNGRAE